MYKHLKTVYIFTHNFNKFIKKFNLNKMNMILEIYFICLVVQN